MLSRLSLCAALLAVAPAFAESPVPAHVTALKPIGTFKQWQAATHRTGDGVTCFAFTRAQASPHHIPGRGDVILSVTRRPRARDVAAISAGFPIAGHEDAVAQSNGTKILFYIAGRAAFARDNQAAITAFGHENSVTVRLHGPGGVLATDHFSLKGFPDAYAALDKVCPKP